MSVLIKGMDMPRNCEECDFCDYEQGNCLANKERNTVPHNNERREWCPLVEVPPHGRLIDADALIDANAELADCDFIHPWIGATLREVIEDAPTIIKAEENE